MRNLSKRCLSALLSVVLLLSLAQPASFAAGSRTENYILSFSSAQSAERFAAQTAAAQAVAGEPTLVTATLSAREAAALRQSDTIETLERDALVRANADEGTALGTQDETLYWNARAIGADEAHARGCSGQGVRVAVLDSGLDVYSEVRPQGVLDLVDPENGGDDLTGHGTAVTGILAAPRDGEGIIGVAPDAEVYVVRVLDAHNEAPVSRILSALDWCMENRMNVVNMSFGTPQYSELLAEKIRAAAASGILLVSSAGNGSVVEYPARFSDVIAVGAVDSGMQNTDASAVGDAVEFVSPGENIYTDSLLGGFGAYSGTSVASPHVAAAAAVLLSKDPTQSAGRIRALLAATAKTVGTDDACRLPDLACALQRYDAFTASCADSASCPPPNDAPAQSFAGEDIYVAGCWSAAGHDGLADNYYSAAPQNIRFPLLVKRVSASVDADMGSDKLLHGVSNYVATAELLYEIACAYRTQGFGAFSHTDYRRDLIPVLGESNYNLLMTDISRAFTLHGALTTAANSEDRLLGATDFASVSEKASAIVFGMFFHLLGDIYAHRTVVPTTSIQSTNASSHGTGSGGNSGLYFVKADFNPDCGAHTPDRSAAIRAQYRRTVSDLFAEISGKQGLPLVVAVAKWLGFLVFGKWLLSLQGVGVSEEEQMQLDSALLQSAINIPSNATHSRMCGVHTSCYGALMRLAGMGVLQFKDVKYFLRGMDEYTENGTRSKELNTNWSYYEDAAPSNTFYARRYVLAKAVTRHYLETFHAGDPTFSPFYLLSEPYGESVNQYCLKIDQFYNYVSELDPHSEVLTRAFWQNKTNSLFCYTTIVYEGTYFIDASTYPDAYGKPIYGGVFPVRTDGKTAESFYQ